MDREIRVLHLITRFTGGGAEKTTINSIRALLKTSDNYDVHLGFGAEYDTEEIKRAEDLGITTVNFKSIRHYNIFSSVWAVLMVSIYLWKNNIDIIHTHSTEAGIIGRLSGKLAGTPVIIHEVHGDPVTDDRNPLLNCFIKYMERITAKFSTKIIVKSRIIKQEYLQRKIGEDEQYELIYHGVNLDKFREAEPLNSISSDSKVSILFVGRIEEGKGIPDLIDSFERINHELPTELLIVGDGEQLPFLKEVTRNNNVDDVSFLGHRDDVPQIMAACDVLVLPSYREGTPRVITEAIASGMPVVASDIAGIPEQLEQIEAGYLVQPGNVNELSGVLEHIIESIHSKNLNNDVNPNMANFSIENSMCKYQELYNKITNEYTSNN
ncbi:glycosyltransferase [Halorubrum sodomense]|uniref:Glycosyltransferase involved in cell wall bisynthesis n=1 Tax=Halorubrum sodomense TaxID=35743 RepID=A0A1I6FX99_HALSD|nr:glycosyltransferase [Halorubrum sodomense]SFR34531.1 Glycosyltransferase involved in cell wall bisynthesis [Halorubrum sodomense]